MTRVERPDDAVQCENCGDPVDIEQAVMSEDYWFCAGCYAEFKAAFDKCEHSWLPHISVHGDDGFYCERCCGFVATEDFPARGLTVPERIGKEQDE